MFEDKLRQEAFQNGVSAALVTFSSIDTGDILTESLAAIPDTTTDLQVTALVEVTVAAGATLDATLAQTADDTFTQLLSDSLLASGAVHPGTVLDRVSLDNVAYEDASVSETLFGTSSVQSMVVELMQKKSMAVRTPDQEEPQGPKGISGAATIIVGVAGVVGLALLAFVVTKGRTMVVGIGQRQASWPPLTQQATVASSSQALTPAEMSV
jgi:hypothetical protein